MAKEMSQNLELSLDLSEFGDVKPGVPVGRPLSPQTLPEYLKNVPIGESNAYLVTLGISAELLEGIPIQLACMIAGITFEEVKDLALQHKPMKSALDYAYATGIKLIYLEKIKKGDAKTAMEILGRMVPSLFGEARSTGGNGQKRSPQLSPIDNSVAKEVKNVDFKNMTDEELAEYIDDE